MRFHVHVVVVHYRCAAELRRALASVAEDLAGAARVCGLQAWVVDNGLAPGESLAGLPLAPRVMTPTRNLGFGKGCNLALREIRDGVVLLLNPDTRLLPGSLDALLSALEEPGVGAAGPRLLLDDAGLFTVSEPLDLGPFLPLRNRLKERLPWLGLERRERRRRWRYVTALECGPTRMLCGACLAAPRAVLDRAGLFHEGFFMYFEDLDLVRRIRREGYSIRHQPAARVVHYYDRSARQAGGEKERWIAASHALFLARNHRPAARRLAALLHRLAGLLPPPRTAAPGLRQDPDAPWRISVLRLPGGPGPWLFEFSESPALDISACALVRPPAWEIPRAVWDGLAPKTYWLRLSGPGGAPPIRRGTMAKAPAPS